MDRTRWEPGRGSGKMGTLLRGTPHIERGCYAARPEDGDPDCARCPHPHHLGGVAPALENPHGAGQTGAGPVAPRPGAAVCSHGKTRGAERTACPEMGVSLPRGGARRAVPQATPRTHAGGRPQATGVALAEARGVSRAPRLTCVVRVVPAPHP